jgi:DNA-binding response OmpR family regulator
MAKVALIGIEPSAARQLVLALDGGSHQIEQKSVIGPVGDVLDYDIVFAGGDEKSYLPLLRHIRAASPALPFVVVTRLPETADWLDALEAGATDYCSAPFESQQIAWLMQSALSARGRAQSVAA